MIRQLLLITLIAAYGILPGQTYNIASYNGMTVNTCSGNFYDSGGSGGNYGNNENYVVTFCSNSGSPLYFDFSSSSTALNLDGGTGDTLFFYDGLTTSDPLIAILVKADDYAFSYPAVGTMSSCVTVQWKSNGSATDGGWQAQISCDDPPVCAGNPPAADVFGQATAVCNLNDYCGTTSGYYGEDAPWTFGGTGGTCPSPDDGLFAGTLENNSWLKFIASATSASFDFNVTGGASCDGVQLGIYGYDATTHTFSRKTPCNYTDGGWEGVFTLTATSLTVGQTYYLMIDGNAGSNCDYTIGAGAGVATVSAGTDQVICATSATLTATGATGDGMWTLVSGGGTIATPGSATTTVTDLPYGPNTFRWTVTGGLCADAGVYDDVVVDIICLLPITLTTFTATQIEEQVQLNWTTAQEINADRFIIERALDGITFESIGTVQATGNSMLPVDYTFTDDMPAAVNYYRLKLEDIDGQYSYSSIVAAQTHLSAQTLIIDKITFDQEQHQVIISCYTSQEQSAHISLADTKGIALHKGTYTLPAGSSTIAIPVPLSEAGMLVLQMITGGRAYTHKIVSAQ